MKRSKTWLGLLVACGLLAGNAWAEPVRRDIATLDGVTWIFTVDGGNATVTGVVAPAQSVLTMPSTLGGCPVTDIGYEAFAENNNIAVMVIPDSVRNIGIGAFAECTGLQAVAIGNNVTNIAECAFEGCSSLSAVTFGKHVVTIGPAAFGACTKLTSVKLPDSVKHIGRDAFERCGLTSVTLGKGLEFIGDYAFTECERLETLTLPDNVKYIGEGAFYNALFLRNMTIPDSVTNLGNRAFGGCPNLTNVVLSSNLAALENNLFSNCISLVEVTIPDNVQYIGEGVFWRCERLKELTIPANVTGIGDNAFAQCTGLATLHVPTTLRGALSRTGIPAGCTLDFYVNRQKALFDANGGTCGTPSRIYELDVPYASFPEATREHHAFAGWWTEAEGGERVLESDIVQAVESRTLYAHWTLTEQVATFDPNGGQCDTGKKSYAVGGTYGSLPVPTLEHHAFAGWWTEADGGEQMTATSMVTEKEFQTLYARWTLAGHVVTFNPNGGSCAETNRTYTVGQPYAFLPTPALEHYAAEWYTQPSGGEPVTPDTIVPAVEYQTLYAQWTLVEHVVTFDPNGGTCSETNRTYTVGQPYASFPTPALEHYAAEWYTAPSGGAPVTEDTIVPAIEYQTFHARWTRTEQIVTYDPNGGSCTTETQIQTIGQPYTNLPSATLEHCALAGWYTAPDGGDLVDGTTTVTAADTRTLYAHWTRVDQIVTFDPNGGTCGTPTQVQAIGQPYTNLPAATLEHYALAGWFTARDGGDLVNGDTIVSASDTRTLYAHWTLVDQIALFFCENGTCDTSSRIYKVGGTYSPLPAVKFDDSRVAFVGWSTPDGMVISENTVVAPKETLSLQARTVFFEEGEKRLVDSCNVDENGELVIRFVGEKGKGYALQRTASLGDAAYWHIVASIQAERDGEMELKSCPPEGWGQGFYRVVEDQYPPYLVVDMSGGQEAESWPVSHLEDVPAGGWTDEYKTTKLVLRRIEAGTFVMGSPGNELGRYYDETQHTVTLTKPFWMGVFEVTQRQWELATGNRPSYFNNSSYYATRPVEQVSYNDIRGSSAGAGWPGSREVDASSFLGVLRAKTGLAFDLPTEAQWEYACRAGTTTALNSGKDLTGTGSCPNMAEVGRYLYNGGQGYDSSCPPSYGTAKVGSYQPNAWGLYDMHGNVWEWCLDWDGYHTGDAVDPAGYASGSYRVLRGGGWSRDAQYCRSARRISNHPWRGFSNYGFRLCCPAGLP